MASSSSSSPQGKVAFVTGCNGITGYAVVDHLVRQPESEWSKIIISSRKAPNPMTWMDHRVKFVPLDFLKHSVDELVEQMKPWCSDVTHAFFASYAHHNDFTKLTELNVPLFTNFLYATDKVAGESLERIVVHTGGKHYGVHLGPVETPIHEDMPRYEDHGENFYYQQEDAMFALAQTRNWSWNVIRPNGIIGFTPGANGMSEALTLAVYLLVCRELGQVPTFPGNKFFYNAADDASYAPSIADMSVWAATGGAKTRNEAFNHTNGDVIVWRYLWPKLGRYFGIEIPEVLEFTAAGESQTMANNFKMSDWASDKREVWERICDKYGGRKEVFDWATWEFFDWATGKAWYTFGTASKARKLGWTRYDDTYECWTKTWQAFANSGALPARTAADVAKAEAVAERARTQLLPHPGEAVANRVKSSVRKVELRH